MMIRMSGPFVMTGGRLVGSFYTSTPSDQVTVSYSPDLVNWTPVWQSSGQTGHYTDTISLDAAIGPLVNTATYGYYLNFQFQPATTATGCGLDSLAVADSCQVSRFFAPSLIVGTNNVAIQTGDAVQSGRSLQLSMQWQENSGNTPPTAVSGPVFPLNGSSVDSTWFSFSWQPATDPDGDQIVDYHFELSDDSTMSIPLATNFDRYLSGVGTPVTAQFRPERPDFLNDGETYYWRVRPLDSRGAWGAWSPVWRFTPHGPRQPLNFRYVLVDSAHVQLEWSPNPQGNPAVNYVIYTDSVRGSFPTPALVQATLADTSYVLPISQFRYVRISAVDANGVSSAPSPYITIWPPVNASYGTSLSGILPTQSNNGYALKFLPQDTTFLSGLLMPKRTGVSYLNAIFLNGIDSAIATEVVPVIISKPSLRIQVVDTMKPYGSALPNLSYKVVGFVNGDTSLTIPPSLTTTATASSPVGTYQVSLGGAVVDTNYVITYLPGVLTIIPDTLTITASSAQSSYGGTIPALTVSYSGFVNGDSVSNLVTAPSVATAAAGSPVGNYPVIASGALDSNYTFVYTPGVLTILPDTLMVTVGSDSMVYGGSIPVTSFSYSGFVLGDDVASLTTPPAINSPAIAASGVGAYPLNASGAVDSNYIMVYVSGTLTITPAPLTITPNNAQMAYGGAVPSLTAIYSGFVNGDSATSLVQPPVLTTPATSGSDVGTYPITAGGALDSNYTITYGQAGTLTVVPDTLLIMANSQSMTYGDSVPSLTMSYSGFVNGDDSTVINDLPTLQTAATPASPAGTYPITLNGGSDNDYVIVLQNGMLTVDSAVLIVQGPNDTIAYNDALPALTYTVTGWKNQDSSLSSLPQVTSDATQGSPAGWYPIQVSGGSAPNYRVEDIGGSLLIYATVPKLSFEVQGIFPDSNYTYTVTVDSTGGEPDYTLIMLNDLTAPGMSQLMVLADTVTQGGGLFQPAFPRSNPVYTGILSNLISGHAYHAFAVVGNSAGADTSQTFNIFTQVNAPFVISPNPANTSMSINVGVAWQGITKVLVYSLNGAEVYRNDNMDGSGLTVDVSGLSTGTYIVVLVRSGRSYAQKVMIIH
jgi:hypothetical protein